MNIIICGAGRVGFTIAKLLTDQNHSITVIDQSSEDIQKINESLDVKAIVGKATSPEILDRANTAEADMLIAVTRNDEINMLICQIAYSLFKVPKKIARIRSQEYLDPKFSKLFNKENLPIDYVISPELEIAKSLQRKLEAPGALDNVPFAENKIRLLEILINENCKLINIKLNELFNNIKKWEETRLIVIGDTIVDQYIACDALGMSAEAPVVVVREIRQKNFIGGAAIVAAHIRGLGAKCDFVSVVGADETARLVKEELAKQEIGDELSRDSSRPTTFKKRYMVDNQKLFRVSKLEDHDINERVEEQIIKKLEELAPGVNCIVVSDFVYGLITEKILVTIRELAYRFNLTLIGDVQCSSQVGFVTKMKGFSLICPNEREARIALQDKESGLEHLCQKLIDSSGCTRLVMKLGSDGFIVYDREKDGSIYNQSFPALSVNPIDVAGAGDSLLAVMTAGLAAGSGVMASAAIGCCMAAVAVETMGNTPISLAKLMSKLDEVHRGDE